jgi:NAD(P)-dependent dehydrogenase (short-subunit alcohol dehydrogenase family)
VELRFYLRVDGEEKHANLLQIPVAVIQRAGTIDDNALAELPRLFPDIPLLPIECDVGKESEVSSAFERISAWQEEEPAGIDLLVNNAGIQHVAPIETFPESQWRRIIDLMLTGILPKYQAKGVTAVLFYELHEVMEKYGVTEMETTGIFETNQKVIQN